MTLCSPPPSPDKAASSPVLSWRRGQRRSGRHLCCSVSHLIHLSNKLSASELCNSAVFCSWLVLPKVMVWHNLMNKCRWLKHLSGWPLLFISVASLRLLLSSCLHRCLFMQIWGQWLSFLKLWCAPSVASNHLLLLAEAFSVQLNAALRRNGNCIATFGFNRSFAFFSCFVCSSKKPCLCVLYVPRCLHCGNWTVWGVFSFE